MSRNDNGRQFRRLERQKRLHASGGRGSVVGMKTAILSTAIVCFPIACFAGNTFDERGTRDANDAKTVAEWCDLATKSQSADARMKYGSALMTIARQNDDLTQLEKGTMTTACLSMLKNTSDDSDSLLTESTKAAQRARASAMACLGSVGNESCLTPLFQRMAATSRFNPEHDAAAKAIAAIGGKKAVDGLVASAKSAIDRGEYNVAPINALAKIPTSDAAAGLKRVLKAAQKHGDNAMGVQTELMIRVQAELQAKAADAKAQQPKAGK